jgi:hypothetical protein
MNVVGSDNIFVNVVPLPIKVLDRIPDNLPSFESTQ